MKGTLMKLKDIQVEKRVTEMGLTWDLFFTMEHNGDTYRSGILATQETTLAELKISMSAFFENIQTSKLKPFDLLDPEPIRYRATPLE